jgi:hypothetical protein
MAHSSHKSKPSHAPTLACRLASPPLKLVLNDQFNASTRSLRSLSFGLQSTVYSLQTTDYVQTRVDMLRGMRACSRESATRSIIGSYCTLSLLESYCCCRKNTLASLQRSRIELKGNSARELVLLLSASARVV